MDKVARVDSLIKPEKILGVSKPTQEKMDINGVKTPFSEFFGVALSNINVANNTVKVADKITTEFALGRIENPEDVMIAQEKASIAINYATKITNKILDAYSEIMRMQV